MDHVKELGPTIADIAAAKAGIIKPGSPVVSYGGVPKADAVIARVAREQNAPLTVVDLSRLKVEGGDLDAVTFDFDGLDGVRLPIIGSYQPKTLPSLSRPSVCCGAGDGTSPTAPSAPASSR